MARIRCWSSGSRRRSTSSRKGPSAPQLELEFAYNGANGSLVFRTQEVREILGEACDFANPEIYAWLGAYLKEQLAQVQGKEV